MSTLWVVSWMAGSDNVAQYHEEVFNNSADALKFKEELERDEKDNPNDAGVFDISMSTALDVLDAEFWAESKYSGYYAESGK